MPQIAGYWKGRVDRFGRAKRSKYLVSKLLNDDAIIRVLTSNAPFTDSSQRSRMNSSRAIDSLLTLIMRWHSWGRKNSISS